MFVWSAWLKPIALPILGMQTVFNLFDQPKGLSLGVSSVRNCVSGPSGR